MSTHRVAGNDEAFIGRNGKKSDESVGTSTSANHAHHRSVSPRESVAAVITASPAVSLPHKVRIQQFMKNNQEKHIY